MPVTGRFPAPTSRVGACQFTEADAVLARRPVGWPLSPLESLRFDALAAVKRRREWLAGRLAAKRAVATWLAEQGCALSPFEIEISNEPSGQPVCRLPLGAAGPEISIAHAGSVAVCALSDHGPIGIDCEPVAAKTAGTLALVASGAELARAEFSPEAQTRLWCSKEAVLKLLGLGLSCDPRDVVIEETGARLLGTAQARWEELGRPPIFLSERRLERCMIVVAHTGVGGFHG